MPLTLRHTDALLFLGCWNFITCASYGQCNRHGACAVCPGAVRGSCLPLSIKRHVDAPSPPFPLDGPGVCSLVEVLLGPPDPILAPVVFILPTWTASLKSANRWCPSQPKPSNTSQLARSSSQHLRDAPHPCPLGLALLPSGVSQLPPIFRPQKENCPPTHTLLPSTARPRGWDHPLGSCYGPAQSVHSGDLCWVEE